MNRAVYRIIGIYTLIISIFFILGGIFIPSEGSSTVFTTLSLLFGVILFVVGTVLYKMIYEVNLTNYKKYKQDRLIKQLKSIELNLVLYAYSVCRLILGG